MTREVLIITGACGVGKTTTSRAWARAKKGAVVECDYLTEWIYDPEFPRFSVDDERFIANLAIKIAIEYLSWGMPVVIENVWTPLGLDMLKTKLQDWDKHLPVTCVWLKCDRKENHRRDQQRIPENQMKERVDIVNEELAGYHWPEALVIIDTTHLTAAQTLDRIEQSSFL